MKYFTQYIKKKEFFCLQKIKRKKGLSLVIAHLMLYLLTIMRNCVAIKIGLTQWMNIDALTLISEKPYFFTSATRIQTLCLLEERFT